MKTESDLQPRRMGLWRWALAALCLLGLVWGFLRLFQLRFEAGDVYPPYSSLRADPLGTRALYESLARLPEVTVARNYRPLAQLEAGERGQPSAWILAGLSFAGYRFHTDREDRHLIQGLALGRRRVIMTLLPEWGSNVVHTPAAERRADAPPTNAPTAGRENGGQPREPVCAETDRACGACARHDFPAVWGFDLAVQSQTAWSEPLRAATAAYPEEGWPARIPWHGALYFTALSNAWRVLYRCGDRPVLIERALGKGSLVVATDSYFLSNEALRADRAPALLVRLIGSCRRVEFDETHLGLFSEPGLAALMRQYRLHGFVAGALLLAGLFVWRRLAPLAPAPGAAQNGGVAAWVGGRDSLSGFVNLLRRHVPEDELLKICVRTWNRSAPSARARLPVEAASPPEAAASGGLRPGARAAQREQALVRQYRALCERVQRERMVG